MLYHSELGLPCDKDEAFYITPIRFCACPGGQFDEQAENNQRHQAEWMQQARQIILPLEAGRYADYRLNNFDIGINNGAEVFKAVNGYINAITSGANGWLYLYGPYGLGKTHLAVAATRKIAAQNLWRLTVAVWPQHCSKVQESWSDSNTSEAKLWSDMRMSDILLLDDIDKITTSDWAIQKLYEVIDYRLLHNRVTIITANHSPAELQGIWLNSKREHIRDTGAAIISRIRGELSSIVEFTGKDQRQVD